MSAPENLDDLSMTRPLKQGDPPPKVEWAAEGPGTRIGIYKLLQQLGEGGMGTVYMAEQEQPVRRMVALKIIKAGLDSREVTARFEAERQALALMDHPNIAKVHDAGITPSGRPYFVMELVKGIPITRFCAENRLTPNERLKLFIPVCQAIQHAHQKGIIHRDLKPSNILVAMYDDQPVPKVIDFGVAKATSQKLTDKTLFTEFGVVVGTLEYMSPEQAKMNALDIDTRSDVYSLGVILYELLTGNTPLTRNRAQQAALDEVLRAIREEEPPKPSTEVSSSNALPTISALCKTEPHELMRLLRGELDWIVMKALEKDRARRYDSANGLARDIQRFLADEPVEACPPSLGYRLSKLARKHRFAGTVALVLIVSSLIGVVGITWQAVRASIAEADATVQRDTAIENEKKARDNEEKAGLEAVRANKAEIDAKKQRDVARANETEAKQNAKTAERERDNARAAKEELRHGLYLSQLNLVQNAWDANKIDDALALLQTKPLEPGETELRSFEWHHWNRLLHAGVEIAKLPSRGNHFYFSADATRVAGPAATVWQVPGGKEWFAQPASTALALSGDGARVALVKDGGLEVHDGASSKLVLQFPLGGLKGTKIVNAPPAASLDGEGKRLAVAGQLDKIGVLQVWDVVGSREMYATKYPLMAAARAVLSRDGRFVALALDPQKSRMRQIIVRDLDQGKDLFTLELSKFARNIAGAFIQYLSPHDCLAFSPDGTKLATLEWGAEENVKVWDARTGKYLYGFTEFSGKPSALVFSPQNNRLAVIGHGKIATLWDLPAKPADVVRRPVLHLKWPRVADGEACAISFSKDGSRVFTAEINGRIRAWDVAPPPSFTLAQRVTTKKGKLPLRHLSPDGSLLVTAFGAGDGGGELQIWKANGDQAGRVPFTFPAASDSFFSSVAFHPRGGFVTSAMPGDVPENRVLHVWDIATGKPRFTLPGIDGLVSAAFTGDGKQLAVHIADPPQVRFWNADTGAPGLNVPIAGKSSKLTLSADGNRFALLEEAGDDDKLLYELKTWEASPVRSRPLLVSPQRIEQLAFSPDGRWVTAALGGTTTVGPWGLATQMEVKLWDAATGKERFTLKTPSGYLFRALAFSPDGRRLAAAENDVNRGDHVVKLWDVTTGREILTLRAVEQITKLAFSNDGYRLHGLLLNPTARGDLVQTWDATSPVALK